MEYIYEKLPLDLVINNIMPFAYCPQDKSLLRDIRSFKNDYDLLDSIYSYSYKSIILFNDLELFIRSIDNMSVIDSIIIRTNGYLPFISRNYMLNKKSLCDLAMFHKGFFQNKNNINSKNRIIWGLLSPEERTKFFNTFCLEDDY